MPGFPQTYLTRPHIGTINVKTHEGRTVTFPFFTRSKKALLTPKEGGHTSHSSCPPHTPQGKSEPEYYFPPTFTLSREPCLGYSTGQTPGLAKDTAPVHTPYLCSWLGTGQMIIRMPYRSISADLKQCALWLLSNGYLPDELHAILNVSRHSIQQWVDNLAVHRHIVPPPNVIQG